MAAARELVRYKLDLVGVQEVRWDKGGTVRAGDYNFFYGNMVLRRIFGPKRDGITGERKNYIMRSLMICTPHPILCR